MLLMIEGNEEKFGFVECLYWNLIGLCCFANGFAKRLLFDQRLEMHFVSDRSDPKPGLCVIWMEIQNSFKLARSFQRICINQVSKTGNVHTIFIIVCWLMISSSSMKSFYATEKPMKYEVIKIQASYRNLLFSQIDFWCIHVLEKMLHGPLQNGPFQ